MFEYSDPTGSGLLEAQRALETYRGFVDRQYQNSANILNSAFVTLGDLALADKPVDTGTVQWRAFPKSRAASTDQQIDNDRINLQDEYVEWRVEKDNDKVRRITFSTEFSEYFGSLAAVSSDAIIASIKELDSNANPTVEELYGVADVSQLSAQRRFDLFDARYRSANPWNNGTKGIMGLTQRANTMGALFALVHDCATPKPGTPPGQVCSTVGCLPDRDSDPRVCTASQQFAIDDKAISLMDPVGIEIFALEGNWELDGNPIDISNSTNIWSITRNGRRATLNVPDNLTLDGDEIETGTQVSKKLLVRVTVQTVSDSSLPVFARAGNENSRTL